MPEQFIPINQIVQHVEPAAASLQRLPSEPESFLEELSRRIDLPGYEKLHGGHRNHVVMKAGELGEPGKEILVYWRIFEQRWQQIMKAVLVEDYMARIGGVAGRKLGNPDQPIELQNGVAFSRLIHVAGENRYPWNKQEIQSAARLMVKLHKGLREVRFSSDEPSGIPGAQWLHLDFGRGNVLFDASSANAVAVIDYENLFWGSIEQDLGRTVSLLLVDTKMDSSAQVTPERTDDMEQVYDKFQKRIGWFLETYNTAGGIGDAARARGWAVHYLKNEDYGSLNEVRNLAMDYLSLP